MIGGPMMGDLRWGPMMGDKRKVNHFTENTLLFPDHVIHPLSISILAATKEGKVDKVLVPSEVAALESPVI